MANDILLFPSLAHAKAEGYQTKTAWKKSGITKLGEGQYAKSAWWTNGQKREKKVAVYQAVHQDANSECLSARSSLQDTEYSRKREHSGKSQLLSVTPKTKAICPKVELNESKVDISDSQYCIKDISSPPPVASITMYTSTSQNTKNINNRLYISTNQRAYKPTYFDEKEVPENLRIHAQEIVRFFTILHYQKIWGKYKTGDFIPLKTEYLRTQLGRNNQGQWIWHIIKPYLLLHWIASDDYYIEGQKCLGYKWLDENTTMVQMEMSEVSKDVMPNPKAKVTRRKKERKLMPVQAWLKRNLQRITLDSSWHEESEEIARNQLAHLDDAGCQVFNPKDDFGFRFHSSLTQAARAVKSHLRVDGERLAEIDLSNSQSSFAGLVAKQRGHEDPAFLKLCEEGTVYDYFMPFGQDDLGRPYTREEVKTEFNERLLFCKNGYRSKIKSLFEEHFPITAQFWASCKAKDVKVFAKLLQRTEARFVVYTNCDTIRKMAPATFIATIHDSLLMKASDLDFVQGVIDQSAEQLGIRLKTKRKLL